MHNKLFGGFLFDIIKSEFLYKNRFFVIKLYTNLIWGKGREVTTKYQAMAISSFQHKFQENDISA